jgi:hypothetical protein
VLEEVDQRSFLLASFDVGEDPVALLCGDDRAELCRRIQTVAHTQVAYVLGELLDELIDDRLFDQQAAARCADLTTGREDGVSVAASALSRSASAKTMLGDFPPSSSATLRRPSAARFMTRIPVRVSPVKAIMSTPACPTSASPTLTPDPGTNERMPSVKSGCSASSASAFTLNADVRLAGLTTVAHYPPPALARATERGASVTSSTA